MIDWRIFAEFDHADGVQLVKVPLSDAVWSTWRRYCDIVGVTMGQGIGGLIAHELVTVVGRRMATMGSCSVLRWSGDSLSVSRASMFESGASTSGIGH